MTTSNALKHIAEMKRKARVKLGTLKDEMILAGLPQKMADTALSLSATFASSGGSCRIHEEPAICEAGRELLAAVRNMDKALHEHEHEFCALDKRPDIEGQEDDDDA